MTVLFEHPVTSRRVSTASEAPARRQLRAQIARLEAALAAAVADAFRGEPVALGTGRDHSGPRLLSLGELERVRDELHARVEGARHALAERAEREAAARRLRERMLADPGGHRFARVSARECGEPGCGVWEVKPRLGLLGMLAGWWEVKLSSGCP
jgi:hypothetical protein